MQKVSQVCVRSPHNSCSGSCRQWRAWVPTYIETNCRMWGGVLSAGTRSSGAQAQDDRLQPLHEKEPNWIPNHRMVLLVQKWWLSSKPGSCHSLVPKIELGWGYCGVGVVIMSIVETQTDLHSQVRAIFGTNQSIKKTYHIWKVALKTLVFLSLSNWNCACLIWLSTLFSSSSSSSCWRLNSLYSFWYLQKGY